MNIKYMNTSALVKAAAFKCGYKVLHCQEKGLVISDGKKDVTFRGGRSSLNRRGVGLICSDKEITKAYLKRKKINVPFGNVFNVNDVKKIKKFAEVIGWPLVLKPVNGSQGKGVFAGIDNEVEFDSAIEQLKLITDTVMIEEFVDGSEYRFLFLGDKVIAVMQRIPANIVGDGKLTIEKLIHEKNKIKKSRNTKAQSPILIDGHLINKIDKEGYGLESIPSEGKCVFLRYNSNLSTGGDGIDKTNSINVKVKKSIEKAALSIPGLVWAGIDVIIDKSEKKYAIIEINTSPMISMHHFPWEGESIDVANAFLKYAFSR